MKKLKEEQATVEKILAMLKDGKDVRKGDWTPKEVRTLHLLTSPPSKDDKERLLSNPSSLMP
jgi:obg-like ATPase 1